MTDCKTYMETLPNLEAVRNLPEDACPVDWTKNLLHQAVAENCGKSVMCRDGIKQLYVIVTDVTEERASSEDLELIRDLANTLKQYDGCELSDLVCDLVLASLDLHAEEWDKHVRRKRCTNLVCKRYYTVHVDPAKCKGAGACVPACPVDAIAGGEGLISVVNNDKCTRCGECFTVCPAGALVKAGAVKPRGLPEAPVPVGSLGEGGDGEGGGRRRRRRG